MTERFTTVWEQIADVPHTLEFPEIAGTRTRVLRLAQHNAGNGTILMLAGTTGHIEAYTHNLRALSATYEVIEVVFGFCSGRAICSLFSIRMSSTSLS